MSNVEVVLVDEKSKGKASGSPRVRWGPGHRPEVGASAGGAGADAGLAGGAGMRDVERFHSFPASGVAAAYAGT